MPRLLANQSVPRGPSRESTALALLIESSYRAIRTEQVSGFCPSLPSLLLNHLLPCAATVRPSDENRSSELMSTAEDAGTRRRHRLVT
jgi:hypothetical protein